MLSTRARMVNGLTLAVWLLAAQLCLAQHSIDLEFADPGALALRGPGEVEVGQEIAINIEGLPKFDLSKTYAENIAWREDFVFKVEAPSECKCDNPKTTFVVDIFSDAITVTSRVTPQAPGTVVFLAVWVDARMVQTDGQPPEIEKEIRIATHQVLVGGDPKPGPGPTPNPEPKPGPGQRSVVIIEETRDSSPQWARLKQQLQVKYDDLYILDGTDPQGPFKSYAEASGDLPYLFIVDKAGHAVFKGSCPKGLDAVVSLLAKHGVKS